MEELHQEKRHKVLLVASDAQMLGILEVFVLMHQHSYLRLNEGVDKEDTVRTLQTFNDDKAKYFVLIASTRNAHFSEWDAMRTDTVIFYDAEWAFRGCKNGK